MTRPVVLPSIDEAEADYRATRAILDAGDEPSGAIGWVVTGICAAFMGFAISAQALWEVAL